MKITYIRNIYQIWIVFQHKAKSHKQSKHNLLLWRLHALRICHWIKLFAQSAFDNVFTYVGFGKYCPDTIHENIIPIIGIICTFGKQIDIFFSCAILFPKYSPNWSTTRWLNVADNTWLRVGVNYNIKAKKNSFINFVTTQLDWVMPNHLID